MVRHEFICEAFAGGVRVGPHPAEVEIAVDANGHPWSRETFRSCDEWSVYPLVFGCPPLRGRFGISVESPGPVPDFRPEESFAPPTTAPPEGRPAEDAAPPGHELAGFVAVPVGGTAPGQRIYRLDGAAWPPYAVHRGRMPPPVGRLVEVADASGLLAPATNVLLVNRAPGSARNGGSCEAMMRFSNDRAPSTYTTAWDGTCEAFAGAVRVPPHRGRAWFRVHALGAQPGEERAREERAGAEKHWVMLEGYPSQQSSDQDELVRLVDGCQPMRARLTIEVWAEHGPLAVVPVEEPRPANAPTAGPMVGWQPPEAWVPPPAGGGAWAAAPVFTDFARQAAVYRLPGADGGSYVAVRHGEAVPAGAEPVVVRTAEGPRQATNVLYADGRGAWFLRFQS